MTTEQRIARLERTVATWKRAAIGLAVICVCLVCMGQAPQQKNAQQAAAAMKVNELTLTDKNGNVALVISGAEKGVAALTYPGSKASIKLEIGNDAAEFGVDGGNGLSVVALANKEIATLALNDENLKAPRVQLSALRPGNDKTITSAVTLSDRYGDPAWKQTAK